MRKALSALLLIAASLSVSNCTKNYPTSYVYDTVKVQKTLIPIQITSSGTPVTDVYSDSQMIYSSGLWYPSDTFYVPDSARLTAYINGEPAKDTTALPGLVWHL